jgi:uncharacterized protein YjbI with pentapeptide repeats
VEFHLLPWTDDEVLEYLLAAHKDHVARAFAAWRNGTKHDLGRWPGACRLVLDLLATEPVGDPLSALSLVLRRQLELRHAAAVDHALRTFVAGPRVPDEPAPAILNFDRHLFGSSTVLAVLAAARVVDIAIHQPRKVRVQLSWPPSLRIAIQHKLQTDPTIAEQLLMQAHSPRLRHKAVVLTCLCAHLPAHRPARPPRGDLSHACLRGIDLNGMHVRARMEHADLDEADLRGACLRRCNLAHASLRRARAELIVCPNLHAPRLRAVGLDAPGSHWPGAQLMDADFRGARLDGARFLRARLDRSRFEDARLCKADFSQARLVGTTLASTDLEDACCNSAHLEDVDLRSTCLHGSNFQSARLERCNLAGSEVQRFVAPLASFAHSDLTASRWRLANLAGARFHGAGLADVDWEGADLRSCDFRWSTFHLGNSRSGIVDSTIASEGTRTCFYTDESLEEHFRAPEEVRKANLRNCDLRGAHVEGTDFYLVDVRGARLEPAQRRWLQRCRAILDRE